MRGGVRDQSERALCSELKIEHLKPNCCLETQIAGNYRARLQWGENRWYCQWSTNLCECVGVWVSGWLWVHVTVHVLNTAGWTLVWVCENVDTELLMILFMWAPFCMSCECVYTCVGMEMWFMQYVQKCGKLTQLPFLKKMAENIKQKYNKHSQLWSKNMIFYHQALRFCSLLVLGQVLLTIPLKYKTSALHKHSPWSTTIFLLCSARYWSLGATFVDFKIMEQPPVVW